MKSLTWLHDAILADAEVACGTDTHRDRCYMSRRTECEGESFLTITLPNFARDFERCLEQGQVTSKEFLAFRKLRVAGRSQAIPAFLSGMLRRVFDPLSGVLLERPCVTTIAVIRQICLVMKKVELPCADKRVRDCFDTYVRVDKDLADHFVYVRDLDMKMFEHVSGMLWSQILGSANQAVLDLDMHPKHGPGATAEKVQGNSKYRLSQWHSRLEPYFPFDWFGVPNPNQLTEGCQDEDFKIVEPDAEQPVRVVSVPKTLSGPRIIAIEPVCMQYTQQAVAKILIQRVEAHSLTSGHINFSDQGINRHLAQDSSRSRCYATVDLSEASDRVHQDLVARMLGCVPALRDAVFACRSTRAALEDGRSITLSKFASMGSALCFPIEAMVFFTVALVARFRGLSTRSVGPSAVRRAAQLTYVYGDDIIVPVDQVPAIRSAFSSFGLVVNDRKTFFRGSFRESCGMDAYDGVDVTPVYCRQPYPSDRKNVEGIVSWVSFANLLYSRGWWMTAKTVREEMDRYFGPFPHVLGTSPGLGWTSLLGTYTPERWNKDLHRWETKVLVPTPAVQADPLEGWPALLKFFLLRKKYPLEEGHLQRSSRRSCAALKRRWAPPY